MLGEMLDITREYSGHNRSQSGGDECCCLLLPLIESVSVAVAELFRCAAAAASLCCGRGQKSQSVVNNFAAAIIYLYHLIITHLCLGV